MQMNSSIELLGNIEFAGMSVPIYIDKNQDDLSTCRAAWRMRNPDSCYQGILYIDNETGKITYPEGAIIPEQTPEDREIIPKFIITGNLEMNDGFKEKVIKYLDITHKRKNGIIL
jgi:hypothetical protein